MRVGIIGGGQLAMMLCEAARDLRIETVVLDPNPKCSSSNTCDQLIVANYDDFEQLEMLSKQVDVVTYEFENVDCAGINYINEKYNVIPQGSLPLMLANDRLIEKNAAADSGFKPAQFKAVSSISQIEQFATVVGYPLVLKTRRFGYDGKGQFVIEREEDLQKNEVADILKLPAIVEQMIDLDYELSVIVIRNPKGEIRFMPSAINTHINNILFESYVTKDNKFDDINKQVKKYIEYHNLIGIITVEVFVSKAGEIYFNEIAPRPHNSGHYSIEGCNHSQFEMHIRSICNMQLPKVDIVDESLMINVLGQDYAMAKKWYSQNKCDGIYFHDYFKEDPITNRKMAHITAVGAEAISRLNEYQTIIKERDE